MAPSTTDARAAVVSRTIREAGMRPLPSGTVRGREGIRVSRGTWFTSVSIVIDLPSERERLTADVIVALEGAGYSVSRGTSTDIGNYLTVVRHTTDADCEGFVGSDDLCIGCGVHHGEPCPTCGGRGYHAEDCAPKAAGPILVTVTADDEPMPIHEETRRAFNAGIRASEAAVRAAARNAGLIFTGDHPHREGDVYTRVWTATDGTVLRAKVERVP